MEISHDQRDPQQIGDKILELRKANPGMSITSIADLVLSPLGQSGENGTSANKGADQLHQSGNRQDSPQEANGAKSQSSTHPDSKE